jgi:hypothetical protein
LIVGLKAFVEASLSGFQLYDFETTLAEAALFNFDFYQLSDGQIIQGVQLASPTLGELGTNGELDLYMGATGGLRENTNFTMDGR